MIKTMKFLKYFSLAAVALLAFSCQKEDKTFAAPAEEVGNPILNPHADVVVDETTLGNNVTFTWSEVDYGYHAQVTYSLFAVYNSNEVQLGQSFTTSYTMTKEALNNLLVDEKGLAAPVGEAVAVELYVTSSISSNSPSYVKTSEKISVKVTTIAATTAPWIRRNIQVPGSYQGWAPADAPLLWETGEDSYTYSGLVNLIDPAAADATAQVEFKFTVNGGWDVNLGGSVDSMTPGGDNLKVDPGIYWIVVKANEDFTSGSVTLKKAGAISVIGDAVGGWELANDLKLVCTDNNAQVWSGVCDNCLGGGFKFRLTGGDFESNPWEMNWGGPMEHLVPNGDNISTNLTGSVKFSINFRGDVPALAQDATNPSPYFATVEKAE